jgi:hypothetical protein
MQEGYTTAVRRGRSSGALLGKTYWMLVTTQENFDVTREHGFDVQGVDSRNRRKAVRMSPEDRIIYYISDRHGFAATATVTSEHFEDHTPLWKHHRDREHFPHRVNISADVVLDEDRYLDAYQIGPTLEYVKKWAPEQWPLAFFGMLHIIPQRDFNYLEEEMRRTVRIAGRSSREEQRRRRNRRGGRRHRRGRLIARRVESRPQAAPGSD